MEANEIRIGNIVMVDNPEYHPQLKNVPLRVTKVEERVINRTAEYIVGLEHINQEPNTYYESYSQYLKFIKPIELTKNFFRRNKRATGWCEATEMIYIGFLDGAVYECENNESAVHVDICSYGHLEEVKHTLYIHELQNLYFILTKQEIEVKL